MPLLQRHLHEIHPRKTVSDFGWPLNSAIAGGHNEVVELLLNPGFFFEEELYPSFLQNDHVPILRLLAVRHDAGALQTTLRATAIGDIETAIHYSEILRGPRPEAGWSRGWKDTLMDWGPRKNDESGYQLVLDCILYVVSDHGHEELVQYVISNGASVTCRPAWSCFGIRGVLHKRNTFSALEVAAKRGHLEIVRFLLKSGATPTQESVHQVARLGWLGITRTLLDVGVHLWSVKDCPESRFVTDLAYLTSAFHDFVQIVRRGHVDIARLYLHSGFNKRTHKSLKERVAEAYRIAQREDKREMLKLMDKYVYNKNTGKGWLRIEHMGKT